MTVFEFLAHFLCDLYNLRNAIQEPILNSGNFVFIWIKSYTVYCEVDERPFERIEFNGSNRSVYIPRWNYKISHYSKTIISFRLCYLFPRWPALSCHTACVHPDKPEHHSLKKGKLWERIYVWTSDLDENLNLVVQGRKRPCSSH